jgi:protein gp37
MGEKTGIEWTDSTWNPIRARNLATGKIGWHCEHVSDGCKHCYSESMNRRLGTGLGFKPGHRSDVEIFLDEKILLAPLRWKTPRRIFVNSMSDTFAEFVKDEWLDRMFAVMALAPQHMFQVLTKRPERMREYMTTPVQGSWAGRVTRVDPDGTAHPEWDAAWRVRSVLVDILPKVPAAALNDATAYLDELYGEDGCDGFMPRWPLPNVWLGVSAEDCSGIIQCTASS